MSNRFSQPLPDNFVAGYNTCKSFFETIGGQRLRLKSGTPIEQLKIISKPSLWRESSAFIAVYMGPQGKCLREVHVRFPEIAGVKFPRAIQLWRRDECRGEVQKRKVLRIYFLRHFSPLGRPLRSNICNHKNDVIRVALLRQSGLAPEKWRNPGDAPLFGSSSFF